MDYTYYTSSRVQCQSCQQLVPVMAYIRKRVWYKPWTWYQPFVHVMRKPLDVLDKENKAYEELKQRLKAGD